MSLNALLDSLWNNRSEPDTALLWSSCDTTGGGSDFLALIFEGETRTRVFERAQGSAHWHELPERENPGTSSRSAP